MRPSPGQHCGGAAVQSHFCGRSLRWLTIPTESPTRPFKCGGQAAVLPPFVGEAIWEFPCCSSGFLSFFFLLRLVFVSLPVFIKLVKFLLQCCQACIIVCSSHRCALQLPGNWVWRRHVKRQKAPSESPCWEQIIEGIHKVWNGHIFMNYDWKKTYFTLVAAFNIFHFYQKYILKRNVAFPDTGKLKFF